MFSQPISMLLSSLTLCGAILAGLQVSFFSATSTASALTASVEINGHVADGIDSSGKHLIHRAADGLFYVNGKINGIPVKFAIDTGATVVVLNANDAERVGLKPQLTSTHRIRTAAGYSAMKWADADELVVAGKRLGKINIAVMDGGPTVSLLGLSALSRMETVTIKKDKLIIR
ncbi:retropepsin-like aspartic protease family protein [Parasphingorhabdus cellanae]|uniref:TIGR02281 family clan AA aspartic protease n=1 Tax=Parasphingorhabdus cellanae TaxID=2806553 RepID=A0ABX7T7P2_9SPHN|nr:TIGR02281 family clan AA aspartic protease [Parasphingorhabdus cellanae]QTD56235.1 TIGR02281 family clan AA aspartic protease [Parasphingorhabdus cellanae]